MNGRTRFVLTIALTLALAGPTWRMAHAEPPFAAQGSLQPLFAPWDDVEDAIVGVLASARARILVQAYLLTSKRIATTLVAAHRRGIDVQVMVDAGQLEKVRTSKAPALAAAGIPVWIETRYQNAHNKLIVVDHGLPSATVITGSFNFTWTAQRKNAENVLIARHNPVLAARYADNWERHRLEAQPFKQ